MPKGRPVSRGHAALTRTADDELARLDAQPAPLPSLETPQTPSSSLTSTSRRSACTGLRLNRASAASEGRSSGTVTPAAMTTPTNTDRTSWTVIQGRVCPVERELFMPRLRRRDIGAREPVRERLHQPRTVSAGNRWPLTAYVGQLGRPRRTGNTAKPRPCGHTGLEQEQPRVASGDPVERGRWPGKVVQHPVAVDDLGRHRVARMLRGRARTLRRRGGPGSPPGSPAAARSRSHRQPRSRKKLVWSPTPAPSSSTVRPARSSPSDARCSCLALVVPLIQRRPERSPRASRSGERNIAPEAAAPGDLVLRRGHGGPWPRNRRSISRAECSAKSVQEGLGHASAVETLRSMRTSGPTTGTPPAPPSSEPRRLLLTSLSPEGFN